MQPSLTEEYINHAYHQLEMSIYEIAKELNTYPNKVRKYVKNLRTKAEAQVIALKKGRHKHPTKGKTRSNETKRKIGKKIYESWQNISPEDREKRTEMARQQWVEKTKEEKKKFHELANKALRKAAENGSRLEKYILTGLKSRGYKVDFHQTYILTNEKLEVDLLLPDNKIAIEIDGPTHFLSIWGEEKLTKQKEADINKNGLLIESGYKVIRVKNVRKSISDIILIKTLELILETLEKIDSYETNIINLEV